MRKRMTKNPRFVPRISRQKVYGWYESSDRVTRGELSYLDLSRLWMRITASSCPDDLGEDAGSPAKVRYQVPEVTPGISLATALAITLHPEARR
jgi:hypothetical protein